MEFSILVACTLSLAVSVACFVYCAAFSRPSSFRKEVESCHADLAHVAASQEAVNLQFTAHRGEMNSLAEMVEGMLQSIERKRKQTATAAARLNQTEASLEPEIQAPASLEDARMAARRSCGLIA